MPAATPDTAPPQSKYRWNETLIAYDHSVRPARQYAVRIQRVTPVHPAPADPKDAFIYTICGVDENGASGSVWTNVTERELDRVTAAVDEPANAAMPMPAPDIGRRMMDAQRPDSTPPVAEVEPPQAQTSAWQSVAKEADAVRAQRGAEYGGKENAFPFIAELWQAYMRNWSGDPTVVVTEVEVAEMMALFKLGRSQCRMANGKPPKRDDYVDWSAYVHFAAEFAFEKRPALDPTGGADEQV